MAQAPFDPTKPPKTLSPADAAAYIGVTVDTWYRHVHPAVVKGDILNFLIGRQRRIVTASLDAWVAQRGREGL